MAKKPSDQVFELRFSLQDYERDMFSSAIGAYQMNRLVTPIITLMNDVTGMIVFLTLLASLGVTGVAFTFLLTNIDKEDVGAILDAFLSQREQAAVITGATLATRGPIWGLIDLMERAWGVNLPDFGGGFEPEGANTGGGGGF